MIMLVCEKTKKKKRENVRGEKRRKKTTWCHIIDGTILKSCDSLGEGMFNWCGQNIEYK